MTKQQGLLTETDLIKIGNLIDTRLDAKLSDFATRKELTEAISHLPTKDEFTKQLSEFLKTSQDKSEEEDVHNLQHENLGKDTTKLKQQVKHLFKTFEIEDPTSVVTSY